MKKLISLVFALAMVISLVGCGVTPEKPDTVITTFCDAMKDFDFETMSSCMAFGVNDFTEDSEDDDELTKQMLDYMKSHVSKMKYSIENSEVNDNNGTVTVNFEYVDLSPVVAAVMSDYVQQAFTMALSGADEDTLSQLFMTVLSEKKDSVEVDTAESTVVFSCIKTVDGWKIDNLPDEIEIIMTSNVDQALESISYDDMEFTDSIEEEPVNTTVWHDVSLGQEVELSSITMCVTKCEEAAKLESEYSSTDAQPGTKFVIFTVDVENITKSPITFESSEIPFYDSQERSYSSVDDAYWYIDDSLEYVELSPNIKQTGKIIYNVPEDAQGYYFAVSKAGTDDCYRFFGE